MVEENVRENPTFKLKTIYGGSIDDALSKITAPKITEFVDKIVTTLENEPDRKPPQNLTKAYRRILQEYSEFTGFHLTIKKCQISSDLSKIHVTTVDEGCREHGLDIAVDWNETAIFIPLGLNLPEQVTNSFPTNFPYLTEIYSKFIAAIEDLQPFFDVMDDLDRSCCVLDPEVPTRRDCYRRIWLGEYFFCGIKHTWFGCRSEFVGDGYRKSRERKISTGTKVSRSRTGGPALV